MKRLVLASQSPRRRELLTAAGIEFSVRAPRVREERALGEPAAEYVTRLAREKAAAVGGGPDEVVLGADTVVVLGEEVLEKPRDASDAVRMLAALSGRTHSVVTGVCLLMGDVSIVRFSKTLVEFDELSAREILGYVESGEPMDKAGAYAIQGLASKFIVRIEGDYSNVVGLPVSLVYRMLAELISPPEA